MQWVPLYEHSQRVYPLGAQLIFSSKTAIASCLWSIRRWLYRSLKVTLECLNNSLMSKIDLPDNASQLANVCLRV